MDVLGVLEHEEESNLTAEMQDVNIALDDPIAFPRPDEGWGLGRPPFRDEERGVWIVSRYSDVVRILLEPETFSSKYTIGPDRDRLFDPLRARAAADPRAAAAIKYSRFPIVSDDGAVHRRERSFIGKAFTPRHVRSLEQMITSLCEELTDAMVGQREAPFVQDFAVPLPVKVIAYLLGLPVEDYRKLRRWSDWFQGIIGSPDPGPQVLDRFTTAAVEFTQYIAPLIEERREHPGDDLISVLAAPNHEGERQSTDAVLGHTKGLLLGGNKTTSAGLSGTMLFLARSPELQAQLRSDPSLIPAAVEEGLRLSTPVNVCFRTATADAEVAGVRIAKGEHVLVRLNAANRDDTRYGDPLRPHVERSDLRHVAFGRGAHVCPGAPLARAELRIAFETLLGRTSAITVSAREDAVVPVGNFHTATIGELYLDVRA
jgi:cytochrome P450